MRPATEDDVATMQRHPLVFPFRPPVPKGTFPAPNPCFPFEHPQELNYDELDPVGRDLVRELNKRPWCETTCYCSGHPTDRPEDEQTLWTRNTTWEGKNRWDVSEELEKLQTRLRGHRLNKENYQASVKTLLDASRAQFLLGLNVYKLNPFYKWLRISYVMFVRTFMPFGVYQLPEVTLNPLIPVPNLSISIGYFGVEHRQALNSLFSEALRHVPI